MRDQEVRGSDLLTTREVAELLGITRKTLYEWRKLGDIKPIPGNPAKMKQPQFYRRRDIERLLQRRMTHMSQQRKAS